MSESAAIARTAAAGPNARRALVAIGKFWFIVALAGHWIFAYYIAVVFGGELFTNGVDGLRDSHLPNGFIEGDTVGNLGVAAHVLMACVLVGGGPLQLIPQIRSRLPTFHRWLGRTYVTFAVVAATAGLYLIWTRPLFGSVLSNVGTSTDGVLIIAFAALAISAARRRDSATHYRWAMRLFLVTSAVWFLRVQLMLWFALTGGAGINAETFTGPFIDANSFAQFLLPLAVLEAYWLARDRGGAASQWTMAGVLLTLTLLMGFGIAIATLGMWLPRL